LTWSETSSKSARPAKDFESCETISTAESVQCSLVRRPAQLVTCLPRRIEMKAGRAELSRRSQSVGGSESNFASQRINDKSAYGLNGESWVSEAFRDKALGEVGGCIVGSRESSK
jgi:hypothetical protein